MKATAAERLDFLERSPRFVIPILRATAEANAPGLANGGKVIPNDER